jgi:hypothetical protein
MPFEPFNITRQHVLDAVQRIENENIKLQPSTGFDVIINEKAYPPKEIMRYAHEQMNSDHIWEYSGGDQTNKFLSSMGFEIQMKSSFNIGNQSKRYWLYAPGENARKWDDFYETGIMGLGWNELGDLNQYENKEQIAAKLKEKYRGKGSKKNDARANLEFKDGMKIGDVIIAKKGRLEYLGYGIVASEYYFNNDVEDYKSLRKVDWKKRGSWVEEHGPIVLKTLTDITKYPDYVERLKQLIGIEEDTVQRKIWFVCQGSTFNENQGQKYLFAPHATKKGQRRTYWDNMKNVTKGDIIFNYAYGLKGISIAKENSYVGINPNSSEEWSNEGTLAGIDFFPLSPIVSYQEFKGITNSIKQITNNINGPLDTNGDVKQGYLWEFNFEAAELIRNEYNKPFPQPVESILFGDKTNNKPIPKTVMNTSLNMILYGPPGTGKTYHSIDKAVQLANGSSSGNHSENKLKFDELRNQGQIEFVTFHQNYSYEDFMVGLRPDVEFEQLRFTSHKGIFYKIAKRARENYEFYVSGTGKKRAFEEVFEELIAPVEKGEEVEIKMASGISFWITQVSDKSINFRKQSGGTQHTLSIATLKDLIETERDFPSGLASYYTPLVRILKERRETGEAAEPIKNFVIIIDEINRANISKVFGELITLLEDDKRLGQENELKITLPNGEKDFGVPPNLYIIGTMNTADKSIALIDIALRRRFEFLGFYPQYDGLDEGAAGLLRSINTAIHDRKKSADYLVGHAYFMRKQPIDMVLKNKVVPLLMEYFSGKTDIVSDIFDGSGWNVNYDLSTYGWNISRA